MKLAVHAIRVFFLGVFLFLVTKGHMAVWLGLFGISLLGALFFGRIYCGYICPMNTVMIPSSWLGQKLTLQLNKAPKWLQSNALPWMVMFAMIGIMIVFKKRFEKEIPMLMILLGVSILTTLRFEPWVFHNHLCPFGLLQSIVGKQAMHSQWVHKEECIGCKQCEKVCPSQAILVDSSSKKAFIDKALCHQCLNCRLACPREAIAYGK